MKIQTFGVIVPFSREADSLPGTLRAGHPFHQRRPRTPYLAGQESLGASLWPSEQKHVPKSFRIRSLTRLTERQWNPSD